MRRSNIFATRGAIGPFVAVVRGALVAALLGVLSGFPAARAQSQPADLRGIYVYTALDAPSSSPDGQSTEAALNLPGVDGMLLVGLWSSIEPSKGQFQWTDLDRWLSYAVSHGKKITLVIRDGDGTPSWLFQPAPNGGGATPLHGWDAVTSSFLKSFPDKSFSVAIITNPPQLPFPAIDENGAVITGMVPDQNPPLLQLASQKFPGHLVVQFNFLLPGTPANPFVIQAAQTLGTLAGFQTNNFYSLTSNGAACGGTPDNPTPCTKITSTSGGTLTASVKGH